ncbi:MAG: outer membrane beta-barrel protein [Anaerolineales bacterium]
MSTRRARTLALILLALGTRDSAAQVMAAIGPAFSTGDFNSQADAGTGYLATGRVGFGLLLLGAQFEVSYAHFEIADPQSAGDRLSVSRLAAAGNVALHLVRVGGVRPYVLLGASFGRRETGEDVNLDTSWRLGYHFGGGVDFALGPVKPFVEARYVSVDAPGAIRDTYFPIMAGLRLF